MRRREKLVRVDKQDRYVFIGKFDRFVLTNGVRGVAQQIVFRDVTDEYGNKVSNYVQFDNIKTFLELNLHEGDLVCFCARIVVCQNANEAMHGFYSPYTRTYVRLLNPTKAEKLRSIVRPVENKTSYRIQIIPHK